MPTLVVTIAASFVCGCLAAIAEHRAFRIFNTATVGGALLYTGAFVFAFAVSFGSMALVGTALGTYPENNRVILAGYAAGFALLVLVYRARNYRRS